MLLDVYLPDVSGLDLLGALREAAPEVDVLVISAAREADTVRRALRGGIVHYLMKPFSYDDLRVRLEHYQQAYAAMAGEHTDQADVDRVFGVSGADKRLPKGFSAETLRLVEDTLRQETCGPLRGRGGQPARDLAGQRPAVPRAPGRDRQGRGRAALRRGRPARAPLRLAVSTGPGSRPVLGQPLLGPSMAASRSRWLVSTGGVGALGLQRRWPVEIWRRSEPLSAVRRSRARSRASRSCTE